MEPLQRRQRQIFDCDSRTSPRDTVPSCICNQELQCQMQSHLIVGLVWFEVDDGMESDEEAEVGDSGSGFKADLCVSYNRHAAKEQLPYQQRCSNSEVVRLPRPALHAHAAHFTPCILYSHSKSPQPRRVSWGKRSIDSLEQSVYSTACRRLEAASRGWAICCVGQLRGKGKERNQEHNQQRNEKALRLLG